MTYQISISGEGWGQNLLGDGKATAIYQVCTIHEAFAKCITHIISHSHAMANRYYCPHFTEEEIEAHRY